MHRVMRDMTEDHPFWQFSLAVYGTDGVAPACLALQESCGADVNVLLFCCWAGRQGSALTAEQLDQALNAVGPWHQDIVKGLRAVRQHLKDGFEPFSGNETEPLRQKILGLELEAEKAEQHMLAKAVPLENHADVPDDQGRQIAADNIALYFSRANLTTAPDQDRHMMAILSACFPKA